MIDFIKWRNGNSKDNKTLCCEQYINIVNLKKEKLPFDLLIDFLT